MFLDCTTLSFISNSLQALGETDPRRNVYIQSKRSTMGQLAQEIIEAKKSCATTLSNLEAQETVWGVSSPNTKTSPKLEYQNLMSGKDGCLNSSTERTRKFVLPPLSFFFRPSHHIGERV